MSNLTDELLSVLLRPSRWCTATLLTECGNVLLDVHSRKDLHATRRLYGLANESGFDEAEAALHEAGLLSDGKLTALGVEAAEHLKVFITLMYGQSFDLG